jgi:quinol-cytochrome oxidoreductase complex cytochrome b subunit
VVVVGGRAARRAAAPTRTPNPSKAPWYFLGLQEILVYFDPWHAGVVLPTFIILGLMVLPYIDINPKGNGYFTFTERKYEILTFFLGFHVLWILLIVVGRSCAGRGGTGSGHGSLGTPTRSRRCRTSTCRSSSAFVTTGRRLLSG